MTTLDPRAGTHFTGKIFVTPHALDRAVEHFGVDRGKAPNFVMDHLRKATFIDFSTEDDGKRSRIFGYKRIVFVVDAMDSAVITLYPQHSVNQTLLDPVQKILVRTLKAAQRKEKAEEKRINIAKAQLNIRRAECELRKVQTNSAKVVAAMNDEITQIDEDIARLGRDLLDIKREKKNLCKSIVAYL